MATRDEERQLNLDAAKAAAADVKRQLYGKLQSAGHTVAFSEGETTEGAFADSGRWTGVVWTVNGGGVRVTTTIEDSPYSARGPFKFRFYLEPASKSYQANFKRQFMHRKAGFDLDKMMKVMVEQAERSKQYIAECAVSERASKVSQGVETRLREEFGLGKYSGYVRAEEGRDTVKVEMRNLTEEQARAIMAAAKQAGVLSPEEG